MADGASFVDDRPPRQGFCELFPNPHLRSFLEAAAGCRGPVVGAMLILTFAACANHPNRTLSENAVIAQRISVDYQDLVAATLLHHNEGGGSYCIKVFHRGPSSRLRAQMAKLGHTLEKCPQEMVGLTISSIREPEPGTFSILLLQQCGPLCGFGIRFRLRVSDTGEIQVISSNPELEF